jgi:TorA maturation chaperone TorD
VSENQHAGDGEHDLLALADLYRLLSRLWIREVDGTLLARLSASPLREAIGKAGGRPPTGDSAEVLEELQVDYCRLFIGPRDHLPPLQSVWQIGQLQGPLVVSMSAFVALLEADAAEDADRPFIDHLGFQLEVMGRIVQRMATATEPRQRDVLRDVARTFYLRHLSWPGPLLDAAERRAETAFYAGLMRMTRDLLQSEHAFWEVP